MEILKVGDTRKRVLGEKRKGGDPFASTLTDLASPLFSFCFHLRRQGDPGPMEPLRRRLDELFRQFETSARIAGISQADVRSAEYALAAYVDELILTSEWPLKDAWMGKPLQLDFFNTFSAGEEFYNTLDSLRHSTDGTKRDLLELYFVTLSLGFRGKFADLQGQEKRKILIDNISRELAAARGSAGAVLSPRGVPEDEVPQAVKRFPLWIVFGAAGTLILGLILLYSMLLGSQVESLARGAS